MSPSVCESVRPYIHQTVSFNPSAFRLFIRLLECSFVNLCVHSPGRSNVHPAYQLVRLSWSSHGWICPSDVFTNILALIQETVWQTRWLKVKTPKICSSQRLMLSMTSQHTTVRRRSKELGGTTTATLETSTEPTWEGVTRLSPTEWNGLLGWVSITRFNL